MFDYLKYKDDHAGENVTALDCFNALTSEQKLEVEKNTIVLEFKKGEVIIKQGFIANQILLIEKGLAKLDVTDNKKTSTVRLLPSGSFVGLICTFACRTVDFSATAIENTSVKIINIDLFQDLIKSNGDFAFKLIQHMSSLTNNMVHWITRLHNKNIDGALAMILLEFAEVYKSNSFKLPITRIELAKMIGYSKESVINTLSKFNKENIVKVQDKSIDIIDIDSLNLIEKNG